MKAAEAPARYGKRLLTVDEFLDAYAHVDDGNRHELQDGEVIVSPQPGTEHGELHYLVNWLLGTYEDRHPGIRVFDASSVQFSDKTLRGPDVTVVRASDDVRIEKSRIVGTPSLLIEIVSPEKPRLDLVVKRGLYASKGVPEIWFLETAAKQALFLTRKRSGDYAEQRIETGVFSSKVLRGLNIDVAALFALDKKRLRKALEAH